jgi:hypothetical protein
MATMRITVTRDVTIELDLPGTLQGLVDQLNVLIAKSAIGPDSVVQRISGGSNQFQLELGKPE